MRALTTIRWTATGLCLAALALWLGSLRRNIEICDRRGRVLFFANGCYERSDYDGSSLRFPRGFELRIGRPPYPHQERFEHSAPPPTSWGIGRTRMPLWYAAAAIGIPTCLLWARAGYSRLRRRSWLHSQRCPECGYDLAGNTTGICPECGESVHPARSRS